MKALTPVNAAPVKPEAGITNRFILTYLGESITVDVPAGTDMESAFRCTCVDTGETLTVKGWLVDEPEQLPVYTVDRPHAKGVVETIPWNAGPGRARS
jgi:hypothetical protein